MPQTENCFDIKVDVEELVGQAGTVIDEDSNLIQLGLDSVNMMRLASQWRRKGLRVSFAEMIAEPTLRSWRTLASRGSPSTPIPAARTNITVNESAPFDLALMQHAYWIGRSTDQQYGGVAAHFYNEFDGSGVDTDRLERSVKSLARRHGMLRVRVLPDGRQCQLNESRWPGLRIYDLRKLSTQDAKAQLEATRQNLSRRCMDVSTGEVFDFQVSLLPAGMSPNTVRIHLNLEMIAADALSVRVLLADLAQLYESDSQDSALPPLAYSFPRYIAERSAARQQPEYIAKRSKAKAYWRSRLEQLPAAPLFPMRINSSIASTFTVRRYRWLDAQQADALSRAARAHGLTPAMALAAIYAEALTAWSTVPDFILNVPIFDREPLHADVNQVAGDFTSSLLLAWSGSSPGTFSKRAQGLQRQFHADIQHAEYAGVEVLRDLSRERGMQVLAPVVFTSALGLGELYSPLVRRHFGDASWITSQSPQVWLDLQVSIVNGGLLINLDARDEVFEPGIPDAIFHAYDEFLHRLISTPDAWDQPVPSLLPCSQKKIRAASNSTSTPISSALVHEPFFTLARQNPTTTAILDSINDTAISYGDLSYRALCIAADLMERGIKKGDVVAVRLPRGAGQIAAVLGILAAGATYLPLAKDQPKVRLQRILELAGVVHVIDAEPSGKTPLSNPVTVSNEDLAYVIYTSGSTGEPKGVEISHKAVVATLQALDRQLALGVSDRTLCLSALEFDLSVYDIFAPLSVGGALVIVAEQARRDPDHWLQLMQKHSVTVLNCVPALLDMLLSASSRYIERPLLRAVLTGGDWIGMDLPERTRQLAPECRFLALGGATETTIYSNIYEVTEVDPFWKSIPYGKPLDNERFRVVDALGRDCPDFVAGELWIGGVGVARGYRGDPVRTNDKFVSHEGVRWYRTGDRARYWPDGNIEFLGRDDLQKKLRGHRVELGEIESVFESWPAVSKAVAMLSRHGLTVAVNAQNPGRHNEQLQPTTEAVDALSEFNGLLPFLQDRLPSVMQPDWLWICDKFPLTANGKIDRAQLAASVDTCEIQAATHVITAPATPLERQVAQVWRNVLDVQSVGREHNFFLLGGDSLQATRVVRQLIDQGIDGVSISRLFSNPRFEDFISGLHLSTVEAAAPTPWRASPERRYMPFPPNEVQRAYWLGRDPAFTLGGVGAHFYREYDAPGLDIQRLERAVDHLIERHDMLRAVFDEHGEQRVLPDVPGYHIQVTDVPEGVDPSCAHAELRRTRSHHVFDPQQWPLFSISTVRQGRQVRLAVSHDNLTLDALSILNFYSELGALYESSESAPPAPAITFRDYLENCAPDPKEVERAQTYWHNRLADFPPAPQLSLQCDPATIGKPNFSRFEASLNKEQWSSLGKRAAAQGVTASAVLLTAFADVLSRWSQQPDLSLNLTLFDRRDVHPDIDRVMGDFTSLTLVPHRPVADEPWGNRVRRTQSELVNSLDHRAFSTPSILREMARRQGVPAVTMPVVFTSALGVPGGTRAPETGPFSQQVWGLSQTPQVWLDHQVVESSDGVALNWDAVTDLFPPGMVQSMFDAYIKLLDWLCNSSWSQRAPDLLPWQQRVRREATHEIAPLPPIGGLHAKFFELAAQHGARTALRWGKNERMSYEELAARALRVAATLRKLSVGAGEAVCVHMPKGCDQITAVLGVLAAGAAYVPIGVEQPQARLHRMLQLANARFIITQNPQDCPDLPKDIQALSFAQALEETPLPEPDSADPEQLAYIIFTSGSTGEPKGVCITHQAAQNTILDINRRFAIGSEDSVLAVSAQDFDLSVYDIFGLLSAGGSLVLTSEEGRRDPQSWLQLLQQHRPSIWNSAPALLDMLMLSSGSPEISPTLRLILVSGDWVGLDLPARARSQHPDCRFVALGGATEASIWSNYYEVRNVEPHWRSIPYGLPLANQRLRVVNSIEEDCPDWVPGELWIGGAGVALGYAQMTELNSIRYVTDQTGVRWYRTGDQARFWPDGVVEFLGRKDNQIKLHGHRIELGEIDAALLTMDDIRQAQAVIIGKDSARRLAAAVVPRDGTLPDARSIREHLRRHLPPHMVPEHIQLLPELPLTSNGKVDRKSLVFMLQSQSLSEVPGEEPTTQWECIVADIWRELLGSNHLVREESFFALGGDSLMATRFIERLRRVHGLHFPMRELFLRPSLREVALALDTLSQSHQSMNQEEGVL